MRKSKILVAVWVLIVIGGGLLGASAQGFPGSVSGYVYDAESGAPIYLATVTLEETTAGCTTEENGFFAIRNVAPGPYVLVARFVGYAEKRLPVQVHPDVSTRLVIKLSQTTIDINEATISGERQRYNRVAPVAAHRITPEKMQMIPSLGGQADLAQFIQILPGVTFTGDRGGQLYIQGGSPIHNKTLLDGMTIMSPFHSIGFMSVFDPEVVQTIDVFKSAFTADYGGRVSSVIDVRTRPGNRTRFSGLASQSNLGMNLRLEGPIIPMTEKTGVSLSYLVSTKNSIMRSTAPVLYPWLDSIGLPYRYNDFYGKVSAVDLIGNQIDFYAIRFSDAVKHSATVTSSWNTTGAGLSYVFSPRDGANLFITRLAWSDYNGRFEEPEQSPQLTRYGNVDVSLRGLNLLGAHELMWGLEFTSVSTNHTFRDYNGVVNRENNYTSDIVLFVRSKLSFRKWLLEPGFHLRVYSSVFQVYPEPRLKLRYKVSDRLALNLAGGLYSQNLISTASEQDVVQLFQGFYTGMETVQDYFRGKRINNPTQRAWHAVTGASWFGDNNLKLSAEAYVKDFWLLVNYNNNKIYDYYDTDPDIPEYLSKFFIIEKGWAYGLDLLLDWSGSRHSLWAAYSLGYITREDEYQDYTPHFDRRHNVNLVFGYLLGEKKLWSFKSRWQIASGFPFTQTTGYYEDFGLNDGTFSMDEMSNGPVGIIFGELNGGRLPWYHRLDVSLHRTWKLQTDMDIEFSATIMNLYNRSNIFYYNRVTQQRINQLPIMPTVGAVFRF